eukprot:CAMPEP_0172392316 /NCGR_PEP_ID=MMETSP1061-20121228/8486_1 /TAXON_ID=37318 /ORGANISM="Pseudo-nitzschia pungens, Strain cf. pungens" /LENGTH=72 /DNA_ID=CAMNT_0013123139 /DNA_START=60 /DNA_END=278 /DNA_ORIENTATION=+
MALVHGSGGPSGPPHPGGSALGLSYVTIVLCSNDALLVSTILYPKCAKVASNGPIAAAAAAAADSSICCSTR